MLKNPRKLFHAISYCQYPLMLAAVGFYLPFVISMVKQPIDWSCLNYALIFFGVALSFSTLQDTTTTQNNFSKKIWQNPKKGKIMILVIALMALFLMLAGFITLFNTQGPQTESVAVGLIVLAIGMVGLLKAAIEMFENHRLDKQPVDNR